MDNMQRLESQISMYHTIFMICIVLFVLFLLVDIFLFIKLDIRKVIGFLTGKTARKTTEEMKAGGFGESARLSGKVSGTKKKKKAKDSKNKRKGMDIMTPSGQIKLPGSDEVMQSTGSDITDVLHGSEPTDPIAEETSSATDILEERQKPSHKGYFKIVKEIMLTHTDEVI